MLFVVLGVSWYAVDWLRYVIERFMRLFEEIPLDKGSSVSLSSIV